MVNFGLLVAEIGPVVWATPANFNGFRIGPHSSSFVHFGTVYIVCLFTSYASSLIVLFHLFLTYLLL